MLEGITILNEFTTNTFNANAFFWGFLISVFVELVVCIFFAFLAEDMSWMAISVALVIPSILIGGFCGDCLFAIEETQYQVLISEEVSMTEFNERYKIVDQEGQIFTIREKEMDKNV
jgi:ABC-type uncharacterized transport system permease subunit